jgi:hypothetical protein
MRDLESKGKDETALVYLNRGASFGTDLEDLHRIEKSADKNPVRWVHVADAENTLSDVEQGLGRRRLELGDGNPNVTLYVLGADKNLEGDALRAEALRLFRGNQREEEKTILLQTLTEALTNAPINVLRQMADDAAGHSERLAILKIIHRYQNSHSSDSAINHEDVPTARQHLNDMAQQAQNAIRGLARERAPEKFGRK